MKKTTNIVKNETGSMILMVILILAMLSIIGLSLVDTGVINREMVANNVRYQMAFYGADGGVEAGIELIERDIFEREWTANTIEGNLAIMTTNFCMNRDTDTGIDPFPSDTNQDVVIPVTALDTSTNPFKVLPNVPQTHLKFTGDSTLSSGSAIQLAAGYEGKGKGAGGGGTWIIYDIRAYHERPVNTASRVTLQWRHVM